VITLNYNLFERSIFGCFGYYLSKAGLTFKECLLLAGKLNTKERLETLQFMCREREADQAVVGHIEHLIAYFNRCSENRNVVAHSTLSTAIPRTDFLQLFKSSKDDWSKVNWYHLTLTDLRILADQIRDGFRFSADTFIYLEMRDGRMARPATPPGSLPQKPPVPSNLPSHPTPQALGSG
jgi:hypothetical protein